MWLKWLTLFNFVNAYVSLQQETLVHMNIFLIRHGQTHLNKSNTHQYPTTPLSDVGLIEARSLAQRLREAKVDLIYSSPFMRAKQTAEVIAEMSGKSITFLDELREIKRPSVIEGKSHEEMYVKEVNQKIHDNFSKKNWHHSDEENFWDVRYRVEKLMDTLQNEVSENVLVVSHGVVIKMFLSLCIFKEKLSPESFLAFYKNVYISNTGISHCSFSHKTGWKVVRVNDAAHLSEN